MKITSLKLSGPEIFLILAVLLVGIPLALAVPPGGGTDEETHLVRVWDMSALYFIPNQVPRSQAPFPVIYWNTSYRRPLLVRPVDPDFYQDYGSLKIDSLEYIYDTLETRSVYSPPLLLPQMLVMRYLGRGANLPALTVYVLSRIAGLLAFLLLAWLAVRLMPFGKWLLALMALSPSVLFHAATINTDAISNGIGFLFIGGSLFLAQRPKIGRLEWLGLLALFALLFLAKVNLLFLVLLPFLLIPPSRFKSPAAYAGLIAAVLLLGSLLVGGWNYLAYARFNTALPGADPLNQVRYVLTHPFAFAWILLTNFFSNSAAYLRTWMAVTGYNYWPVPQLTFVAYSLGIAAAVLLPAETLPNRRTRLVLLLLFGLGWVVTVGAMYVSYNPVGSAEVQGVQGRYFAQVMPLLFLALVGLPAYRRWRIPAPPGWAVAALGGLALAAYLGGVVLAYHVPCGTSFYKTGLCYQPVYKNWAPNERYSPPIEGDFSLRQIIQPECHGLKEIRVWLDASAAAPQSLTELTVEDTRLERVVYRQALSPASLPNGGWLTLPLETDWQSGGKYFDLSLRAAPGSAGPGAAAAYSLRKEYDLGSLYVNETQADHDLVFQYGCVAGWQKLIERGR